MKECYIYNRRVLRLFELPYFAYLVLLYLTCFCSFTLQSQCNNNVVLSVSGPTVSDWTAPATGGPFLVKIEATGASGGSYCQSFPDTYGGTGATMVGEFIVQNGEQIRAIAGEGGFHSDLEGGGGGGGSGAVNCGTSGNCASGTVLIIAAGGSGGQLLGLPISARNGIGLGGSASTAGTGDGGSLYPDGDPLANDSGGGGGGLNGDGESDSSGGEGGGQVSLTALAAGGAGSFNPVSGNNRGGDGMGGGGGGGDGATYDDASGGGGGHTGGWGGLAQAASSFNSGTNQMNTNGVTGGGIGASDDVIGVPSISGTVTITCLNVLPVSLINFRGFLNNQSMSLVWSTATEIDNMGFDIEHSVDGRNWATLGFVSGQGSTIQQQDYSFEHADPKFGVNYYRLKQIDYDGNYEYSPIVVVDNRNANQKFEIFPNPSHDGALSLRLQSTSRGEASLEVFDWTGLRVYKDSVRLEKGTMVWPVSMTTFPKGAYTARMELPGGEVLFKKVLLQ